MSDNTLITFKAISNFIIELGDMFSKRQHSLKLYCHLINKTTIAHDKPIQKHIDCFSKFCVDNRECIVNKNCEFSVDKISYSDRVFIDVKQIFSLADQETQQVIWRHLLCISALVDPSSKAKEVLQKEENKCVDVPQSESQFLENIMSKVEDNIDPNAEPMQAISSIMQSGVFSEMVGSMHKGVSDGTLDIGKLMGTVQNMMGDAEGGEEVANPMAMLSTMMGAMGGGTNPLLQDLNNNNNN